MMNASAVLASCGFFRSVSLEKRTQLESLAQLRTFVKGTMIFRQGQACPGLFIVGSGLVRIFKMAPNGKEHVLHLVSPGHTFAEIAVIAGFDCPAFAEAIEDSHCVVIPAAEFRELLKRDHALCLQILTSMAMWVKHLVGLVEDITLRDAAGRVARYLLSCDEKDGEIQLPSLKRHLASHLNLTSETLSRTLRRLGDIRAIESDGEGLRILDAGVLHEIAGGEGPLV